MKKIKQSLINGKLGWKNVKRRSLKILSSILFTLYIFGFVFYASPARAEVPKISVFDEGVLGAVFEGIMEDTGEYVLTAGREAYKWATEKAMSVAFWSATRRALNTVAYDTATYLGNGAKGQKPMFMTEDWGTYFTNIADNAAGEFIENMGRDGIYGEKFNLCNPNFNVRLSIGLGLVERERPSAPACSFSKMKDNWEEALKSDSFLNDFQDMFNPVSNDLGAALTVSTGIIKDKETKMRDMEKQREEGDGWLDAMGISGKRYSPPQYAKSIKEQAEQLETAGFIQNTQNGFKDALNIFVNQLALTAFQKIMSEIGKDSDSYTNPYEGDYGSFGDSYAAGPYTSGISGAKKKFAVLVEPDFSVRGDYDVLAELSMCPKPDNAGPTECVINESFKEAIMNRLTVGEAMKQGYLNGSGIFGFESKGIEPTYIEGYPYRSMMILRKFRIIPVGWEIAAQYIKQNENDIGGVKNLEYMVDCFSGDDGYGSGVAESWCQGLIDPDWVLKAPLNYCKREGPGGKMLSQEVMGEGDRSELAVSWDSAYCADEQGCIKENDDGSCQFYGYCSKEKRKWNFGTESCSPVYNTCETYRRKDGQTMSYLENTIDFGGCSINYVGCAGYCEDYNFGTEKFTCDANSGDKLFVDRDVEECDSSAEGCHGLIRMKSDLGVNLLYNSSYEDVGTPDAECDGEAVFGTCSLKLLADVPHGVVPLFEGSSISMNKNYFTLSLYAKDCGDGGFIGIGSEDWVNGDYATSSLETSGDWKRFAVTHLIENGNEVHVSVEGIVAGCRIDGAKIELGKGASPYSEYGENGLVYEKVLPDYLDFECYNADKTLKDNAPEECSKFAGKCSAKEVGCELYTAEKDGISIPAKAEVDDYCPAECVGYNDYLQVETLFDDTRFEYFIPNNASPCIAEAAGCDAFTNLDRVGLVEEGESEGMYGAENVEYYTYLKQCKREADASCGEFYSWEGSAESGYQLKFALLEEDGLTGGPVAISNVYKNQTCTAETYDLVNNPMCRQYYNKNGEPFYVFLNYTVTCSDDCHPYRRTLVNIDETITTEGDCTNALLNNAQDCTLPASDGEPGCWDVSTSECIVCKNGGTWNSQQGACIYMAIPGEGKRCSGRHAGCREYSGSTGNNMRTILKEGFEGSVYDKWGGDLAVNNPSSESLVVGGKSLHVSGGNSTASTTLGFKLQTGKSYSLSFLAKGDGGGVFDFIGLGKNQVDGIKFSLDPVSSGLITEWRLYEFNLQKFDNDTDNYVLSVDDELIISADGDFYIDNIKLIEISDRYFLINDSFNVPESCGRDIFGNPAGEMYNLGCAAYEDRFGDVHNIRKFSQLCRERAVGCEMLVDTHNSSVFEASGINGGADGSCSDPGDLVDCELAERDNVIYMVYDLDKVCSSANKGCQLLGKPFKYTSDQFYSEVYLKNNPDKYNEIMCKENLESCDEFEVDEGVVYFKDPGNQLCEWRKRVDSTGISSWGWWKSPVKRCDDGSGGGTINGEIDYNDITMSALEAQVCLDDTDCSTNGAVCDNDEMCRVNTCNGAVCSNTGNACSDNNDCPLLLSCVDKKCRYSCVLDKNDYECSTAQLATKTIGYGGEGNEVYVPTADLDGNWVGLCAASEAGCTEFIDPVSDFSKNELFNGDFRQDVKGDGKADGWEGFDQEFNIETKTMYVFSVEGNNSITLTAKEAIFYLAGAGGNFAGPAMSQISISSTGPGASDLVYVSFTNPDSSLVKAAVFNNDHSSSNNSKVSFHKVVVDYQINDDLDTSSCNGIVNRDEGCVLFNQRGVSGGNGGVVVFDVLNYDADNSPAPTGIPGDCGLDDCDSNVLLKVSPDRDCSEWLACRSLVKDQQDKKACFDIGLCDALDDNGVCSHFVAGESSSIQELTSFAQVPKYSNTTGYSRVGVTGIPDLNMKGMYPLGGMNQVGESIMIPNGNFELSGDNDYPVGWRIVVPNVKWDEAYFKVIDNPVEAQDEGIGYSPEGNSFLRLGSAYYVVSDFVDVLPSQKYVVSAMMNTINLTGPATLRVEFFQMASPAGNVDLNLAGSRDWEFVSKGFSAPPTADRARIVLGTNEVGNFYVDDVKLKPGLNAGEGLIGAEPNFIPQSCRLYPTSDSLSCEYIADSGARMKGWWGYCLQYDRAPGNPNTCLLWWPVDRVKGDGIADSGHFSGYTGRYPLYYCEDITANFDFVEKRKRILIYYKRKTSYSLFGINLSFLGLGHSSSHSKINACPAEPDTPNGGYVLEVKKKTSGSFRKKTKIWIWCTPSVDPIAGEWYPYNGNLVKFDGLIPEEGGVDETVDGVMVYDHLTGQFIEPEKYFVKCDSLRQTVNSLGQNKVWSGRVYPSTTYKMMADLGLELYGYEADDSPFGAAVPPEPVNNPYEWDGSSKKGIQPLTLISGDDVRAGSPLRCTPGGVGNKCGDLGYCNISKTVCLKVAKNNPGGLTNNCIEDDTAPCYVNWEQSVLACPEGEVCVPEDFTVDEATISPTENLKRIFAKSYGKWEWQGNTGKCFDTYADCSAANNSCPGGTCSRQCKMYYNNAGTKTAVSDNTEITVDDGSDSQMLPACATPDCACNTDADCAGVTYNGWTAANWNDPVNGNTCEFISDLCADVNPPDGVPDCIGFNCCQVGVDEDCTAEDRQECIDDYMGRDPLSSACRITMDECTSDADCSFSSVCEYSICTGGDNDGQQCRTEHTCTGSYCVIDTQGAGKYTQVSPEPDAWDVPDSLCNGNGLAPRPAVTFTANDYCAILPIADENNISVNDNFGTGPVYVSKNGMVNLTFTSDVDENQMPLVAYYVDWGDEEKTVVSGVEMYDKPNLSDPHSLYHIYDYWDMKNKKSVDNGSVIECASAGQILTGTGLSCKPGSDCCAAKPGIKIKDNWGYCNETSPTSHCADVYSSFGSWVIVSEK